jgi:hypothetical protein
VKFRSVIGNVRLITITTEAINTCHTNMISIRPMGKSVFKVIDHNNL